MAEIEITPVMVWAYAKRQIKEQSRNLVIIVVSLLVLYYAMYRIPPTPFDAFATSTEKLFKDINAVKLPTSKTLITYKVDCARAANMIENSGIYKNNGNSMATYLRNFGDGMIETGYALRKMYEHGNGLFETFDIEIRDMIKSLRTETRADFKINYISLRMAALRKSVQNYQAKVSNAKGMTRKAILNGSNAQKALFDGRREAASAGKYNKHDEEVAVVDKLLKQFENVAIPLEELSQFLVDYDDKLMELEASLKTGPEIVEASIERLWNINGRLKKQHSAFIKKGLVE